MSSLVALEVSADTIRAAEIASPFSKEPKLVKVGELQLPENSAGESIIRGQKQFTKLLTELWEKEKFKTKNVALVVGGREYLVRRHETQHPNLKSLREVIHYEAAHIFPETMHDPVLDFYPTNHVDDSGDMPRVAGLVIGGQSGPIEVIVNAISEAKLNIEYVDYAPMAIARYIKSRVNPRGDYILVNVREETTDILVAKDGVPISIRVVAKGLEPKRQLATVEAETPAEDDDSLAVLSDTFDFTEDEDPIESLSQDIRTTADRVTVAEPTILYLTGNRSLGTELARTLEEMLGIEVEALFPTALEYLKDKTQRENVDSEVLASSFVAVCGGMRGK